jgi:hypothetical protein
MSSIDGLLAEARARAHKPAAEQAPQPRLRTAILTCTYRDGIHGFVYELNAGSVRPVAEEKTGRSSETRSRPMTGLEMLRADTLSLKRTRRH